MCNENKVYAEQIKLNIEPLNLTYFKNIKWVAQHSYKAQ